MGKDKKKHTGQSQASLEQVLRRIDGRFNTWYRVFWYGMLQGAGAVLGAALFVLIVALILEALGLTELSEAFRHYGRYGNL
ncbi:MAG: hypothetical protein RL150_334 [Candidatus Parcubacteria bacterium]|jgi:hypothetical protein